MTAPMGLPGHAGQLLVTALLGLGLAGCHTSRNGNSDDAPAAQVAAPDTVRGRVSVVGNEPMTEVVLSPVGGGAPVALAGAQRATLRALDGLEVMVTGRRTTNLSAAIPRGGVVFEVDSFVVRAVDGVAATDGIVASEGGRFYLVTAVGSRLPASFLPVALRQKLGARVFLAGSLDQPPAAYGIIAERP